jgi:WD40 repeat protein
MVSALTLAPDGRRLAICVRQLGAGAIGENNPPFVGINLWDVAKDRLDSFVALDGSPSDATFTSDGRLWATEAMNNELRRVDPGAGGVAETLDLNLPPNLLTSDDARLYPSPDGKRVVVTGFNTSKTLYRYPGWQRETVLEGPVDCLPCEGAWSADSRAFVAGSRDHALRVWSFAGAAGARARNAGSGLAPVFGPDGKAWAITTDAAAFGPSEATGDARRVFVDDASPPAGFDVARFSRGGQRLAIGRADGGVVLFDVASRKTLRTIDYAAPDDVNPSVGSLLWAPDDSWLAIGRYDGSSCIVRFPVK